MKLGKFISLEGGEGLGKTTNLEFIRKFLVAQGLEVCVTREPGGTELAEKIRRLLLEVHTETISEATELLLVFAARSQHIQQVIKPALSQGKWVLCDRFTDSTYAYQGGGRNMDLTAITWLAQFVQKDLKPDLTLLFDAPVELGLRRAKQRAALDRFEQEQLEFFQNVRNMYLQQAEANPHRIKIIDAAQNLSAVQNNIQQLIAQLF